MSHALELLGSPNSSCFFLFFKTESNYIALAILTQYVQPGLELTEICLPSPPKC